MSRMRPYDAERDKERALIEIRNLNRVLGTTVLLCEDLGWEPRYRGRPVFIAEYRYHEQHSHYEFFAYDMQYHAPQWFLPSAETVVTNPRTGEAVTLTEIQDALRAYAGLAGEE